MSERSLACRIKDEVDALVASGKFIVRHYTYLHGLRNGLACGCAIGVVAACAGHTVDPGEFGKGPEGMVPVIRRKWPEITDAQAAELEMAFEGWETKSACRGSFAQEHGPLCLDPNSEWVKLGNHIHKLAVEAPVHEREDWMPGSRNRRLS